jgi:4-amino-4-deoxy-L-arabinose transferase-like glycosyltransferase
MKTPSKRHLFLWICITMVSLVPFLLITRQLFLRDPLIWPDEVVFVDTAKTLLATGHLTTGLFGPLVPGLAVRANWYPPLYVYLLAGWISLFGPSIESVRLLTLLLAIVALGLMFFLCLRLFNKPWLAWLGTFLLSLDSMFGWSSRIARMEMFVFVLLFGYIICFLDALKTHSRRSLLGAGIFSGLAVATHPLGVLIPASAVITLLLKQYPLRQKIRDILTILVPTCIAVGIWFLSMWDSFHLFLVQYGLQIARKAPLIPYPFQIFQSFLVWRLTFIFYFLLFVTIVILSLRDPKNDQKRYLAVGLALATAGILWGKENMYLLYFQPFIVLIILFLYQSINFHIKILNNICFTIIICITIAIYLSLNYSGYVAFGASTYDYHAFAKAIRLYIPDHSRVFIANLPDPYFDLQYNKTLTFYEFMTVPVDRKRYEEFIRSADIAIVNFKADPILMEYLQKYAVPITEVIVPDGYNTTILLLHHPKP